MLKLIHRFANQNIRNSTTMSLEEEISQRSGNQCELCGSNPAISIYEVPPGQNIGMDAYAHLCETCLMQIEEKVDMDSNHFRCLNDSMWSEVPAVKVLAWRMLHRLKSEGWPQDLLDMFYLEEEHVKWARATGEDDDDKVKIVHRDANGAVLENGDSVVLTKDLVVKGTGSFTAKRGTAVRNISLVHDNEEQIEGKVEGQQIVILTKFVKK